MRILLVRATSARAELTPSEGSVGMAALLNDTGRPIRLGMSEAIDAPDSAEIMDIRVWGPI